MRRRNMVSRVGLVATAVGLTVALTTGPAAAQAGKKYPVPYTFSANIVAAALHRAAAAGIERLVVPAERGAPATRWCSCTACSRT